MEKYFRGVTLAPSDWVETLPPFPWPDRADLAVDQIPPFFFSSLFFLSFLFSSVGALFFFWRRRPWLPPFLFFLSSSLFLQSADAFLLSSFSSPSPSLLPFFPRRLLPPSLLFLHSVGGSLLSPSLPATSSPSAPTTGPPLLPWSGGGTSREALRAAAGAAAPVAGRRRRTPGGRRQQLPGAGTATTTQQRRRRQAAVPRSSKQRRRRRRRRGWRVVAPTTTCAVTAAQGETAAGAKEWISTRSKNIWLTGIIPSDISALIALKNVNFSWNNLSGRMPENIGDLKELESLDLSHNELSGEIPSSISALTSLSRMNLSYNNLSGRIPTGNQLQVLDNPASIYIGNVGLCGPPLANACPGNGATTPNYPKEQQDEPETLSFHLSMIIGFIVGLWVVFCTMLFSRRWRNAYFFFIDDSYDRIFTAAVAGAN